MMDFAWQMLTGAFFVMFLFYRNLRGKDAKRIYEHILLIMMFACLFINMGLVYSYWYPGNYVGGIIMLLIVHHFVKKPKEDPYQ